MFESRIGAAPGSPSSGEFQFGGRGGRGVRRYADLRENAEILGEGTWAVVAEFDGPWHAWQVAEAYECDDKYTPVIPVTAPPESWRPAPASQWHSSLTRTEYTARVRRIQGLIAEGRISQVNLCRVLSAPTPEPPPAKQVHHQIALAHPAPYGGWFDFPAATGPKTWIAAASPELAFRVRRGALSCTPIKGTAPRAEALRAKDYAESRLVARALADHIKGACPEPAVSPGEVEVHPGLVQLVARVEGRLRRDPAGDPGQWVNLLPLLLPPMSVAGVPIRPALTEIAALEPVPRGPYCGAIGWIDVDAGEACFAAMIRSFWWREGHLRFGTGAGITADSDPLAEWAETELKASRLLNIVTGGAW